MLWKILRNVLNFCLYFLLLASLKSLGDKTANLFSKKKDEVEKLANEKVNDVKEAAEDQAKKVGESIQKTTSEAEKLAADAG